MRSGVAVLVALVHVASAAGVLHAEEAPATLEAAGAGESMSRTGEPPAVAGNPTAESALHAVLSERGKTVEVRTGPVVELPGVVKMKLIGDQLDIKPEGDIVSRAPEYLVVCLPGCSAPVAVARPGVTLIGVVVEASGESLRFETRGSGRRSVTVPLAAIAGVRLLDDSPAHAPEPAVQETRRQDLVGERVRIHGPMFRGEPLVGTVAVHESDALTVTPLEGGTVRVPLSSIQRLEVRRCRKTSPAAQSMLIGAGIPVALGMVQVLVPQTRSAEGFPVPGVSGMTLIVLGAPLGALVGGIAAIASHPDGEHWVTLDPRGLRIAVMPDLHGGVRGALTWRF